MDRSRYKMHEQTHPHFTTCTVLYWIPIFTNQQSVQIILDSLKYLQQSDSLKIYAYVILENHLHFTANSDNIVKSMKKFKSFIVKELLKLLQKQNIKTILDQLAFYKKAYKLKTTYQVWQKGIQPKLILSKQMMRDKINCIHNNLIERGYIDEAKYW